MQSESPIDAPAFDHVVVDLSNDDIDNVCNNIPCKKNTDGSITFHPEEKPTPKDVTIDGIKKSLEGAKSIEDMRVILTDIVNKLL